MSDFILPIDGKETIVQLQNIQLEKLKLDEMNPRISYFKDNQVEENLSDEQIVFALTNKKPEAFRKLKDSIHNNKGIVYPIWLEPKTKDSYQVIEGNSRVVIYKQLSIEEPYELRWKSIPSYVLPKEVNAEQKNFIRLISHLRGTNEWDAYEKAKYLYRLWQDDGWSIGRLEKQTKMSEKQIQENIDAFKLMNEQYLPNHSEDPNEIGKFSYFVEYVKDEKLQRLMKKNYMSDTNFCDWVYDKNKLPTGQDVRHLRDIFEDNEAKNIFLKKGFIEAIQILEIRKPNVTSPFYRSMENVIEGLKNISALDLDEIINEKNGEKEKMIFELSEWSKKIVKLLQEGKDANRKT